MCKESSIIYHKVNVYNEHKGVWSSRSPLDGAVCLRFSVSLESQHHTCVNSNAACMQQTQSNQTLSHLTSPAHSTSWMLVHVFYMLYMHGLSVFGVECLFLVAVSHCLSIRLVPFSVPVLPEQVDAALCFHVINHCEPVMIRAAQLPFFARLPNWRWTAGARQRSHVPRLSHHLAIYPSRPRPPLSQEAVDCAVLGGGRRIRFAARLWLCAYKFGIKGKFPTGLCGICCCRLTV